MSQLNEQEKDVFLKLSKSNDADIIRGYIEKVIRETTDVDNLTNDPILNAREVKRILTTSLLDVLDDKDIEPSEPESYE